MSLMHERAHQPLRVTVWGENVHECREEPVRAIYPDGMHATIAQGLDALLGDGVQTRTVTLQDPEHGLTPETLESTDVLTWWGHAAHPDVDEAVVDRVQQRSWAAWASWSCTRGTRRRSSSACSARRARCAGANAASAS
jgi:trehalose utilization protein